MGSTGGLRSPTMGISGFTAWTCRRDRGRSSGRPLHSIVKCTGHVGRMGFVPTLPEPRCACPPGYEISDPNDWKRGCKPKFGMNCSDRCHPAKFVQLPFTDYHGFHLMYFPKASFNSCGQLCLEDCNCEGFTYRFDGERPCFRKSSLFNVYNQSNFPGSFYLKLPASVATSAVSVIRSSNTLCPHGGNKVSKGSRSMYGSTGKRTRWVYLYSFASVVGAIEAFVVFTVWWVSFRRHVIPMVLVLCLFRN